MSKRIEGVREYGHNSHVYTAKVDGRVVVEAFPVPGNATSTQIDLADLVDWVKREHPEMLGANEAATAPPVVAPSWTKMPAGKLIDQCKDNGLEWAKAFCAFAAELGIRKVSGQYPDLDTEPLDVDWVMGWFANAIEAACDHRTRTSRRLSASEAVFGVLAWLTTRYQSITLGRSHDASPAAVAAGEFCDVNGLEPPRDRWNANLTHPTEPVDAREQAIGDIIDIVFDGPPGPAPGRFVEVESPPGTSISFGSWVQREGEMWALRLDRNALRSQR